jgi:hypothetical protein
MRRYPRRSGRIRPRLGPALPECVKQVIC